MFARPSDIQGQARNDITQPSLRRSVATATIHNKAQSAARHHEEANKNEKKKELSQAERI